ncbi:hypothetical protein BT69DRAFT_1303544 [Atractiella rhizophila]|nr:hypothetical protein BT69DRAFT_1303544 [Atractiella rhizophila]
MSLSSSFQLEVLQHTSWSRMTGFGSTDPRDENGILVRDSAFESEAMLCHAELWHAEEGQERERRNHVWSEREVVRNLLGNLSPRQEVEDQWGNASVLFILEFSHPFHAYSPKSFPSMQTSTALTEVPTLPSSIAFWKPITDLVVFLTAQALAKQGVKVILRKSTCSEDSGEEGEGDGEVCCSVRGSMKMDSVLCQSEVSTSHNTTQTHLLTIPLLEVISNAEESATHETNTAVYLLK